MAKCNTAVGRGAISHLCDEEAGHEGPHASIDNIRSVAERKAWLEEQINDSRSRVSRHIPTVAELGMQGPARTSAEGLLQFDSDEDRDVRREHPAHAARRKAGIIDDDIPIENQIVNTAGGVRISDHDVVRSARHDGHSTDWNYDEVEPVIETTAPYDEEVRVDQRHLRQREEDQPLPRENTGVRIHDLVIDDIEDRKALGIKRYGTPLGVLNGRNAARDAYEEVLDLSVYFRQLVEERSIGLSAISEVIDVIDGIFAPDPIPPYIAERLETLLDVLS